jgi:hypothetical protein
MHFDQERWAHGSSRDLEQDDGETGIADQDGLDGKSRSDAGKAWGWCDENARNTRNGLETATRA